MAKSSVSRLFPAGLRKNYGGGGNNMGVYEQEYEAEEETNEEEECQVDYNEVEEDSLMYRGDYAEEEDSEQQHEESDEYNYNGVEEEEENEEEEEEEHQDLVTLTNHDFLDCPICCKPWDAPVYQCENGHAACSSCCNKINYLCAYCQYPIDTRNRIIEKVLESAQAKCKNTKYGCKETMNYKKIDEHEMTCQHEPCSCPVSDCNFVGKSSQLYKHFSIKHKDSAIQFSYNSPFHMTLNPDDKSFILQEETEKFLFVFKNFSESYGNAISVSLIASRKDEYMKLLDYDIEARDSRIGFQSLKFQSVTIGCQKLDDKPSIGFMIVPSHLFFHNGQVELDICIWRSATRKRKHS